MKNIAKLIKYLALGYVVLCLYMFIVQRDLLYHGTAEVPQLPAAALSAGFVETTVKTDDLIDLRAWYAPAAQGKPTIIFFHGNAGTLAARADKAWQLRPYGYGILLLAYRGYSGNAGSPTEAGLARDARAALQFLHAEGKENKNIILYGESLGTGVATQLAFEQAKAGTPVRALVLDAPYTSITATAADIYWYLPVRWLVLDEFDSLSKIARIQTPLLVLHGAKDSVINISQGRALFAAAQQPKEIKIFPQGGHANLYDFGAAQVVHDFIQAH